MKGAGSPLKYFEASVLVSFKRIAMGTRLAYELAAIFGDKDGTALFLTK
jgi:hypothetical protein